jgi:hypothetical protein
MSMNNGRRALGVSAVVILLAGCVGAPGASDPSSLVPHAARSEPHGFSWIDPRARGKDLLYASSIYNCDVYVFAYPRGKLVQTLNICELGFGPAFGLCTDTEGDVFMAMGEGFSIFKFAHGGTEPTAQLEDDSLLPVGCSVDQKTGDLGVASAEGNVAVFKNASGTPQIYSLANVAGFFFCTFDDRGNLFVDGDHNDRSFALAELPKGGSALREITVSANLGSGSALQWDGRHVAIGGTQGSNEFTLDRIRVSGSVAKVVGSTTLDAAPNTAVPFQFWIRNGTVIEPENGNAEIGFWNYPGGGDQTKGIQIAGSSLVGVTVSAAPRRR